MLTRLKISGFKNLVDVDVHFGPFNCITGVNGSGKSNLFDAIKFLSALSGSTLIDAAVSVCREGEKTPDIRSLFHCVGGKYDKEISFEAEIIIPEQGIDDLGQKAEASITFLRYIVTMAYRDENSLPSLGSLELVREELDRINLQDASKHLKFPHKAGLWRKSVIKGKRALPFISTENSGKQKDSSIIKLIQDGIQGRTKTFQLAALPRTVLSTATSENPTAFLARREMQSWRVLRLEPSSLWASDKFATPPGLGADGSHIPATLYYLSHVPGSSNKAVLTYDQIASRLSKFNENIHKVRVERDEKRELLTLEVVDYDGTVHRASSVSGGTLRFLAMIVLELDTRPVGLICLEEPENSIYPDRIPEVLKLLQDIATNPKRQVGPDNPLRQIIINSNSPIILNQAPADNLLFAELKELECAGLKFKRACFSCLPDTWRKKAFPESDTVSKDKVFSYLKSIFPAEEQSLDISPKPKQKKSESTDDRFDPQLRLPSFRDI
ncbi:MAG: AAA family ATPase [Proteobacteria bacterium]|nr:AAA family ATPase [Desulfobacteraceae bacterium]MBU4066806.1 AAA family ATPase [Pseudomonadota bacterium]MBU4100529.1 AAA family ATPase [Pseudomonadota bacterium]MBU4208294.1 AAA family ATPase [Pseudomonadota bacterium]MBU4503258.1 AAA family ATPase [Pseudomonadota bacterium]